MFPALKGCHNQTKSYDELIERIKEAIQLCLEVENEAPVNMFIGIQNVLVEKWEA